MIERRIEIRWDDIDAFRHVNNGVYLAYLEHVRSAWLEDKLGEEAAMNFVLARVEIDFKRELTLADEAVLARCYLGSVGTSSVRTVEEVVTLDGEVAAQAAAVLVAVNGGTSRPLTDAERAALA
jgi:acyl-CoA thioester hydrolase